MPWLWPVLLVALGSTHAAFHDECDDENSESCALSALQRRAHATSGGGIWSLVGGENELVEKKPRNRQSIEVEGRSFFLKNSFFFVVVQVQLYVILGFSRVWR